MFGDVAEDTRIEKSQSGRREKEHQGTPQSENDEGRQKGLEFCQRVERTERGKTTGRQSQVGPQNRVGGSGSRDLAVWED